MQSLITSSESRCPEKCNRRLQAGLMALQSADDDPTHRESWLPAEAIITAICARSFLMWRRCLSKPGGFDKMKRARSCQDRGGHFGSGRQCLRFCSRSIADGLGGSGGGRTAQFGGRGGRHTIVRAGSSLVAVVSKVPRFTGFFALSVFPRPPLSATIRLKC